MLVKRTDILIVGCRVLYVSNVNFVYCVVCTFYIFIDVLICLTSLIDRCVTNSSPMITIVYLLVFIGLSVFNLYKLSTF